MADEKETLDNSSDKRFKEYQKHWGEVTGDKAKKPKADPQCTDMEKRVRANKNFLG